MLNGVGMWGIIGWWLWMFLVFIKYDNNLENKLYEMEGK